MFFVLNCPGRSTDEYGCKEFSSSRPYREEEVFALTQKVHEPLPCLDYIYKKLAVHVCNDINVLF